MSTFVNIDKVIGFRVVVRDNPHPIVCGGDITKGVVTTTAPYIRFMNGWPIEKLIGYSREKGWRLDLTALFE